MKRVAFLMTFLFAIFILSCGNSVVSGSDDTDAQEQSDADDEIVDEMVDEMVDEVVDEVSDEDGSDTGFNPDDPGYSVVFTVSPLAFMGNDMGIAAGGISISAREDFGKEEDSFPAIDSCEFRAKVEHVKECLSSDDCAPEQVCEPDTNASGDPIANSDRCVTKNPALDVGPVTIAGFNSGPITFVFQGADKGYAQEGSGEAEIDMSLIAFNTEYTLVGEAETVDDLGRFEGTSYMPERFIITEPVTVAGTSFPFMVIKNKTAFSLKWTGTDGKTPVNITLTGENGSLVCQVNDDGEFTVSEADMMPLLLAADQDMVGMKIPSNQLEVQKISKGVVSGDGVTRGELETSVLFMTMVSPGEEG
ncbi:hypothetical protein KAH37_08995 [bacterium]|nr:hypothetical protein [bacterium]